MYDLCGKCPNDAIDILALYDRKKQNLTPLDKVTGKAEQSEIKAEKIA